ncbi:alpha/beta fold hydrolase [Pelagibius sp. Alg239-R121]|uniref:alpha/beta fold hydrolase n=1 Tax=Pelagibius sp. Alg239-R121 TaxID=2993448 RepID=UPI0024A68432|nr:alpha/beta hydrolase [Pelagibius sp. Alg239-R121]
MVDIKLGSMVSEITGDGAAVVLIHGLGGSSNSFQPLMSALRGFRAIRPDLPGAGRSAIRPGLAGLKGLAAAVAEMLRAQAIAEAHFVGHSMGTVICQELAVSQPDLVKSMTLFGPILEPPAAAREALKVRAEEARKNGMSGIADMVSTASLSAKTKDTNSAVAAFVRESLMRQDPAGYARHCEALADMEPPDHDAISCPTRLVTGAEDVVAPPKMGENLAARIAGAELHVLPNCGHWTMMEMPSESAEHLCLQLGVN